MNAIYAATGQPVRSLPLKNVKLQRACFSQLAPMLRKCVDVHRMSPDAPAEYLRFYWCMRASFGAFREYRDNIVDLIRTHGGNV